MDTTTPHPAPAETAPLTVEESRLEATLPGGGLPVAEQLLRASGLQALVDRFPVRLAAATSLDELAAVVRDEGRGLWDSAVGRAQGRHAGSEAGALDRFDDRPLYWARTTMSATLRRLESPWLSTSHQRFALLHLLDRAARGISRTPWSDTDPTATRVMVSGFDTFQLDRSVRHSNPSGAAALQLDGRVFDTPHGPVVVRSVVLPVNYADFDQGVVEDAFGPVLLPGADRAHLITTISMTARGRMDVEKWAVTRAAGRRTTTATSTSARSPAPRTGRSRSTHRTGSRPRCRTRR